MKTIWFFNLIYVYNYGGRYSLFIMIRKPQVTIPILLVFGDSYERLSVSDKMCRVA